MAEDYGFKTKLPKPKSLKKRIKKPRGVKVKMPKLGRGLKMRGGLKIPGASE